MVDYAFIRNIKMIHFLLAPLRSLYSLKFYRRLQARPSGQGFFYLAYLSFFAALLSIHVLQSQFLPAASNFIGWLGKNLPEMTLTSQGMRMKIDKPLLLSHPEWGPVLYLEPTKDIPEPADLQKAFLVLTRTKVGFGGGPGGGKYQIQDLVSKKNQASAAELPINEETIQRGWSRVVPVLKPILFVLFFAGIYLWKMMAGFFYSLIGLLFNLFRIEKLSYSAVLNTTFFALTPVTFLQMLAVEIPKWPLPANLLTALTVTTIYLGYAILGTQQSAPNDIIISQ